MRIPVAKYSEISQLAALVGMPDPLAEAPMFDNLLESVPASTAALRDVATGIAGAADDLAGGAAGVSWTGHAADHFRSAVADAVSTARTAAGNLDAVLAAIDDLEDTIKEIVFKVLGFLDEAWPIAVAILGVIGAAVFAPVVAGALTPAAVFAIVVAVIVLVGAVLHFLYVHREQVWDSTKKSAETIARLLKSLCDCDDKRKPTCPKC